MTITIVGQGYVGLPLTMAACRAGFEVYGLDTNIKKISNLALGKSPIEDVSDEEIRTSLNSGRYLPTSDYSVIGKSDVIIICVPTPLSDTRKPDLMMLIEAIKEVSKYFKKESLLIIESTIQPGTCRNILIPLLSEKLEIEEEFINFAYSPERIDPTNRKWNIENTPKLVAGNSHVALERAIEFYSGFINSLIECSSLEIAETAKLLENSFRLVNISLINEVADFCSEIGISIKEVIKVAATKPYGFMPFYPGLGAGGHCIPVDPIYLLQSAQEKGRPIKLIEYAAEINSNRVKHFIDLAEKRIGSITNKKILIIGIAYKPNVADTRESQAGQLIIELKKLGANVYWHDNLVKEWKGEKSVSLSDEFDLAIIACHHDYLDFSLLDSIPIIDTRESI